MFLVQGVIFEHLDKKHESILTERMIGFDLSFGVESKVFKVNREKEIVIET